MTIRKRVEHLEKKAEIDMGGCIPLVHMYYKTRGEEDRPCRQECPTCAAMSDKEYAEYEAWCRKAKRITHVVIVRSYAAEEQGGDGCRSPD